MFQILILYERYPNIAVESNQIALVLDVPEVKATYIQFQMQSPYCVAMSLRFFVAINAFDH